MCRQLSHSTRAPFKAGRSLPGTFMQSSRVLKGLCHVLVQDSATEVLFSSTANCMLDVCPVTCPQSLGLRLDGRPPPPHYQVALECKSPHTPQMDLLSRGSGAQQEKRGGPGSWSGELWPGPVASEAPSFLETSPQCWRVWLWDILL